MRAYLLQFLVFIFFTLNTSAQISRGGLPQEIIQLKSAVASIIEMPEVNNKVLQKSSVIQQSNEKKLKPFKFAHAFQVDYTPENSGEWYKTVNGLFCWRLTIRSKGAKSINLIFDQFELPPQAKLFLFNARENYILGAYTSDNNQSSHKFAVSPVIGDEITIHYETPTQFMNTIPFVIKKVNHDFIGILERGDRRPLGEIAGVCNVDINCELGSDWSEVKNGVCRMIVDGDEICTGVLVNNTKEDQKPYFLSAAHCYDRWEYAETSVYTFNYESPFCAPLDGDPSNSLSGALMKAQYDSLDFALVELNDIPPPDFRPYYAGWDRTSNLPDSSVSIHHPKGDIKKIALDADVPVISSFNSHYIKNGFLKILRWEEGVTEEGSSGGPLFNMAKNVIGTLTGGLAVCGKPIDDYFERFALSWDYKSDTTKQLKYWLDPINSGVQFLDGKQFYEGVEYCEAFTNLDDDDSYELVTLLDNSQFAGYWGGTNSTGITEFVEQFSVSGNEQLSGISLGIGKIYKVNQQTNSEITIKVYNGKELPEELIYSKKVLVKELYSDAMNFIGFDEIIEPSDTFYVGFELSKMQPLDSLVVYQSLRAPNTENSFYFKQSGVWQSFKTANKGYNSIANVFELVACNIGGMDDTTIVKIPEEIFLFPNPASGRITLEAVAEVSEEDVAVYNLIGQKVEVQISNIDIYRLEIDLSGNVPGVYFVRLKTSNGFVSKKVSFVPW